MRLYHLPPLVCLLAASCAVAPTGRTQFNVFSRADDVRIGKQLSREIEKTRRLDKDPELQAYITTLGTRLASVSDWPDLSYHFQVVEDPEVNAFALPGGYIYVHHGLIAEAESEAELASVLAHEIGHVVGRHSTSRLSLQYGYTLIASMLLGNQPAFWAQLGANLFGQAGLLAYSRAEEAEADLLSVHYLLRASYEPEAAVRFFEKIRQREKERPGAFATFFSSHPATADRIAAVEQEIVRLPRPGGLVRDTAEFVAIRARVKEKAASPRKTGSR